MIIVWNNNFVVGNKVIDNQHKQLFEENNKLYIEDLDDEIVVQNLFSFLKDYVITHFNAEEQLMINNNYEKYEYHKKIHDNFLNTVNKKIDNYATTKSIDIIYSLRKLISHWLVDHILNVDMQMKQFYISLQE